MDILMRKKLFDMNDENNQNGDNINNNSQKFSIKQFVVYGILPSLVATFILGAVTTICLLKALPTKIEELEEKIDNIIVSAEDMPSSNNVISEVDLYKFKEEINKNVDDKIKELDEKFDKKLDEKIKELNNKMDSKVDSINKRIDGLYSVLTSSSIKSTVAVTGLLKQNKENEVY